METLRSFLASVFSGGGDIWVDDLYVTAIIIVLPDFWARFTQPLEVQSNITRTKVTNLVKHEVVKQKSCEDLAPLPSSGLAASRSAKSTSKKKKSSSQEKNRGKDRGQAGDTD